MRKGLFVLGGAGLILVVAGLLKLMPLGNTDSSAAATTGGPAPRTEWGDPDLQGIWTDEFEAPLQRPARYADKEFLTDEERMEIDKQRASALGRDRRSEVGTDNDVAGAYNAVFTSVRHTSRRTSLVVDPPDGRIPALTAEAKQRSEIQREYVLALLQATLVCKQQTPACAGGKYGPPSPRMAEVPPFYNTGRLNRKDGPEDASMSERCMSSALPDVGGYRRIVQSPGVVSIVYDVGQGQGWPRIIPVTDSPHLPAAVRQRFGDARGRWEGNTLVVDTTNFGPKSDFRGSRENLHLIERWTRVNANTLEYAVTVEDPTVWTRPWTVNVDMAKQNEQANRIYYEPRCHEGNFGLAGLLAGSRAEEKAFREGKGPDPVTLDSARSFVAEDGADAFAQ